ncbi:hypothetical protein M0D44_20020 [Xanthomonas prunicola]|uniref:hypothetical protein n=1 Tax=Xanthomonas prunicola TaxID=2053930 RepID=UPI0021B17155|nr:hypothetical protein [Xanthomonas prunicola]UXA48532.1 hypothetical protein M0D44_20020 [Xanthomonas prunicola]
MAQAKAFSAAAVRDDHEQLQQHEASTAQAVRMAMGSEPAAFTKYLDNLTR